MLLIVTCGMLSVKVWASFCTCVYTNKHVPMVFVGLSAQAIYTMSHTRIKSRDFDYKNTRTHPALVIKHA